MNKSTRKMNAEGTNSISAAAAQGTAAPELPEAEQGAAERRRGRGPVTGVTLLLHTRGTQSTLDKPPGTGRAGILAGGTSPGPAFTSPPLSEPVRL